MRLVGDGEKIPASFWGESEAGIRGKELFARRDTPVHSVLHELSHIVCMMGGRRTALDRDAGADDDEESAVCYLQTVLAEHLEAYGHERCCDDMDAWGYSFREGSVRNWLAGDGLESRNWLIEAGILDRAGNPTWQLRE